MSVTEKFLIAMLVIYTVPWAAWRYLNLNAVAPLAIVQIAGGIVLGPGILGALMPEAHAAIFNPQVIMALNGIAWWAVMIFVFLAGLELDLEGLWENRRESGITAGLALTVPLIAGSLAGLLLVAQGGWTGAGGAPWQAVIGTGMACAVTALPILILLMEELAILHTPFGQRILRYASLDDIAIWAVLAFILLDFERIGRQAGFLFAFAAAAFLFRRLMAKVPESDRWFIVLIWLAAIGFAADWAGLHYMVGAFLAGAVAEKKWFEAERLYQFRQAVLIAFMPVFFLSTGLRTSWEMGGMAVLAAALLLLFVSVGGKLAGLHLAGRILGWRPGEARVIGWLLQTKALIMIIFVNVLLDRAIITSEAFTAFLLMAVASTLLTIPMVAPRLKSVLEPLRD